MLEVSAAHDGTQRAFCTAPRCASQCALHCTQFSLHPVWRAVIALTMTHAPVACTSLQYIACVFHIVACITGYEEVRLAAQIIQLIADLAWCS